MANPKERYLDLDGSTSKTPFWKASTMWTIATVCLVLGFLIGFAFGRP